MLKEKSQFLVQQSPCEGIILRLTTRLSTPSEETAPATEPNSHSANV